VRTATQVIRANEVGPDDNAAVLGNERLVSSCVPPRDRRFARPVPR
jgi:hypothetical protein